MIASNNGMLILTSLSTSKISWFCIDGLAGANWLEKGGKGLNPGGTWLFSLIGGTSFSFPSGSEDAGYLFFSRSGFAISLPLRRVVTA